MSGLTGLVLVVGYITISLLSIIWLGAMFYNYFLLFRRDAILEELPFYQKIVALCSGPLLFISIQNGFNNRCKKCKRFTSDCLCDHETTCRQSH